MKNPERVLKTMLAMTMRPEAINQQDINFMEDALADIGDDKDRAELKTGIARVRVGLRMRDAVEQLKRVELRMSVGLPVPEARELALSLAWLAVESPVEFRDVVTKRLKKIEEYVA